VLLQPPTHRPNDRQMRKGGGGGGLSRTYLSGEDISWNLPPAAAAVSAIAETGVVTPTEDWSSGRCTSPSPGPDGREPTVCVTNGTTWAGGRPGQSSRSAQWSAPS
jgi:hypothetical protein